MRTRIAVIGVGRMGLPICGRLAAEGLEVLGSDVRPGLAGAVGEAGARWVPRPADAAAAADVVLTVLPGSRELQEAAADIVGRLGRGVTWIDMTSASPTAARRWVGDAQARGAQCLDAPMGGGVSAAAAGSLMLFVGGSAATIERCATVLGPLGTVHHMGGHGAGYTTKLLVNLLWFGQAVATGEALLLARAAGIDVETLRETLGASAAASDFIHRDAPMLLRGDYLASFGLDRCTEQLQAVTSLAGEHGVPVQVAEAVQAIFEAALAHYGPVDGELLPVAWLQERAGLALTPTERDEGPAGCGPLV